MNTSAGNETDIAKQVAAVQAVQLVEDGMKLGLGTGSTANRVIRALGMRVRIEGLRIRAVATSRVTEHLAQSEGIALDDLNSQNKLDLCIDGADEVDSDLNLIKGGGGALLLEKIVAAASRRLVVVVDSGKLVKQLGAFPLPIEVVTRAWSNTRQRLLNDRIMGKIHEQQLRLRHCGDAIFTTDCGNRILDAHLGSIKDAAALEKHLNQVPGVVENGLFVGMCDLAIVGCPDGNSIKLKRPDTNS